MIINRRFIDVFKILAGFDCDSFGAKFTVTKRQLYSTRNAPKSDTFYIGPQRNCRRKLRPRTVGQRPIYWEEKQGRVTLPMFGEKDNNYCGATVTQDEYGIFWQFMVQGRDSNRIPRPHVPRTMFFTCFYPLAKTPFNELPDNYKPYVKGDYTVGAAFQFKKQGKLVAPFYVRLY